MLTGKPITILLVEDDAAHAEIVRRNLAESRIANRLVHLADGQAALDYLLRACSGPPDPAAPLPDLILLDLRLPKVDGQQVLQRLKADEQLRRIPVVILTSNFSPEAEKRCLQAGASGILSKPVEPKRLLAEIERVSPAFRSAK